MVQPRLSTRYGELVARAVRILNAIGMMDFSGHVSARDELDPNVFWINNRHASRSTLTAEDVVPFDISAGKRIGEGIEPPSEWPIHSEMYKVRPDVKGAVHTHPKYILALSATGNKLKPIGAVGAILPEEGAPIFDTSVLVSTVPLGQGLAKALGDYPICVMRQHGILAVGTSVEDAVSTTICSELNAEQLCRALSIGTPNYLKGEELKALQGERKSMGGHGTKKRWHYYEETARKMGALEGL